MKIINFNDCVVNERNGTYGGMAGSKEGIMYQDDYWIVKYPKSTKGMRTQDISYTTAPLSEYIGSHVYQKLGYDVHETLLGIRNGKLVVACKDFCKNEGSLREIRTLKNTFNEELENRLQIELTSTGSQHMVELGEVLIHLENNPILSKVEGLEERFWDCAVVDGFINNNDRNNGNWGLLYENGEYKISPIFDNGASFSNKLSDKQICKRLNNIENLKIGSISIDTTYGIDGKRLKYSELLRYENNNLKKSILKNTELFAKNFDKIVTMISSIPTDYKNIFIISDERKEFYLKSMGIRFNELILPRYLEICKEMDIKPNDMVKSISIEDYLHPKSFSVIKETSWSYEIDIEDDFEDRDI